MGTEETGIAGTWINAGPGILVGWQPKGDAGELLPVAVESYTMRQLFDEEAFPAVAATIERFAQERQALREWAVHRCRHTGQTLIEAGIEKVAQGPIRVEDPSAGMFPAGTTLDEAQEATSIKYRQIIDRQAHGAAADWREKERALEENERLLGQLQRAVERIDELEASNAQLQAELQDADDRNARQAEQYREYWRQVQDATHAAAKYRQERDEAIHDRDQTGRTLVERGKAVRSREEEILELRAQVEELGGMNAALLAQNINQADTIRGQSAAAPVEGDTRYVEHEQAMEDENRQLQGALDAGVPPDVVAFEAASRIAGKLADGLDGADRIEEKARAEGRGDVFKALLPGGRLEDLLAAYAHDAWAGWMDYLFSKCGTVPEYPGLLINHASVERWIRQKATPYDELPEEERRSDNVEAQKILKIVQAHILEELPGA